MAAVIERAGDYPALPAVRRISLSDLGEALRKGFDDFREIPSQAVFLCLIYPLVGLFLWSMMVRYDVLPLLFPLVAGFALLGPFAAVGLFELSRRRGLGLQSDWQDPFDVFRSPAQCSGFGPGVLLLANFGALV